MKILETDRIELALGGLDFEVVCQEFTEIEGHADDGGVTIKIFGPDASERTQLLRFDCFRGAPHYHMPPSAPGQFAIDREAVGDPLAWSLAQIRDQLPEMIERAGFAELSKGIDREAVRAGLETLREAAEKSASANKVNVRVL